MIRAAAENVIDFSTADVLSRKWWLKLSWTIGQLEVDSLTNILKLRHAQHVAVADYKTDEKVFTSHWDGANETVKQIFDNYFPWINSSSAKKKKTDNLLAEWKKRYGDPNDPKVKEFYQSQVDKMTAFKKATAEKAAKERKENNPMEKLKQVMEKRRTLKKKK